MVKRWRQISFVCEVENCQIFNIEFFLSMKNTAAFLETRVVARKAKHVVTPSPIPPLFCQLCDEVSPVETLQPLSMLHVTMKPRAETWAHRVPWGHRCMIYVRYGELTLVPTVEGYYAGEEDREPQVTKEDHFSWYYENPMVTSW